VNDESDPLKRLIIGSWVNYVRDQDNIELISELLEVSLDFPSVLSPRINDRDQGFADGPAKVLLPHRPTNCITRFKSLLYDVGSDETVCTSNLFWINNTIP